MKAFYAILLDSFRMLKSGAIFWVTLGISLLVALLYLSIGFDEKGVTLFFGLTDIESEVHRKGSAGAEILYTGIFIKVIVGFWLSWVAVILALISCASIFPQAMDEGSAGMLLTKRPSRLMVFGAKYAGSLLFMLIQVGVFIVIVLVAMRWRLGFWNLSLFWFLPATLLMFSFLYSFLVVIAVKTRSVLAAILLTMGLWLVSWIAEAVESQMYQMVRMGEIATEQAKQVRDEPVVTEEGGEEAVEEEDSETGEDLESLVQLKGWYQKAKLAYGFFPKTSPMIDAAKNALVVNGERGFRESSLFEMMLGVEVEAEDREESPDEYLQVVDDVAKRHSLAYTLGTSLAFEAVMLSLAAWMFCRRDF
ncbi:MAG: ABC transporter permease [Verrucomicrobiaceae bacterium]